MDGTVEDTITEASVGTTAWQEAIDHGFFIIFDLAMGGNYPNGECDCTTPTSATSSGASMSVRTWPCTRRAATPPRPLPPPRPDRSPGSTGCAWPTRTR